MTERVRAAFSEGDAQVEFLFTERAGHATDIGRAIDLSGCDGLCVLGGDGTVHELINGLLQRPAPISIPIGLIAAGTGNSLHQDLGIEDPWQGVSRILAGGVQSLDLMRVKLGEHIVWCVNLVGWGAVADISARAERLRWLGVSRYSLAALVEILIARRRPATLVVDGVTQEDAFHLTVGCNTKFVGRGMRLAPRASVCDGRIDLVIVRKASRYQMLRLFCLVYSGLHLSLPYVDCLSTRQFSVRTEQPGSINLDGNVTSEQFSEIEVEIVPAALQVFL